MKQSVTKCAIKLTAKKVGLYTLGVVFGISMLFILMGVVACICGLVANIFPILRNIFPFVLVTGVISMFLFMIIHGTYEEYKDNRRKCEAILRIKEKQNEMNP